MDQNIKERPKCERCGIEWKSPVEGGVPLFYYHTSLVCYPCYTIIQNKLKKWIQE